MFFDLSLCVDGAREHSRRELLAMAMRLGYTSVALTHTVVGRMSDSDRRGIEPLKLEPLLAASPGLVESVKFHRRLLGVQSSTPFRQYSRLNVVVEDQVQAAALNPANPVLQSYDIVAVQPKNQKMFLQACTQMEVDLISLDFTQKLLFRIKTPNVKAAVERGVMFEICYGPAIADLKLRRDLFANIQILVGAARGRNIIVSSGARRAMDLRGPNDVANMVTLFGFSMEQSRAAISSTCKSVLLRGFARKQTYKAAIALEHVEPSEKPLFEVPTIWDPLATPTDCVLREGTNENEDASIKSASAVTLSPSTVQTPAPQKQTRKRKKKGHGSGSKSVKIKLT